MALRSENTMAESLQKMLGQVSDMKVLPDADLQFLIELETVILTKLRAPIDDIMGQGAGGQGGAGGMQQMMGGQVPGSGAQGMQQRVPGIRNEASMPNMDEFMRSMGGATGG